MTHCEYICLEGIDGAGKSSQLNLLAEHCTTLDLTPICLHEPSYGRFGMEIRHRARDESLGDLGTQFDLFTADRRDHVDRKIRPLLAFVRTTPGFIILQNRSFLSAAAYQAPSSDDATLNRVIATQEAFAPEPDLILILDVPVELAIARIEARGARTAFEDTERLAQARQRYERISVIRSKCVLVNGVGSPDAVSARVTDAIQLHSRTRG